MRTMLRAWALVFLIAVVPAHLHAAEKASAAKAPAASPAADLVTQALQAELDGDQAERTKLLAEALRIDPKNRQARWASGYVRMGDGWVAVEDVPELAAESGERLVYLKRRDTIVDTADTHRELARWCRQHRLMAEARVHWNKVLAYEPRDPEAIAALGLELHDGRLLSKEQIAMLKREAGDRKRALAKWRPQVAKWRAALDGNNAAKADAARQELAQLSDPSVLPALESLFASNPDKDRANRLNRALIDVAARMPTIEATQILLRRAVDTHSQEVCEAACEALRARPMHTYVPQLLAAMPDEVQVKSQVTATSGGTVVSEHEIVRKGNAGTQTLAIDSTTHTANSALAQFVTPLVLMSERSRAAELEQSIARAEEINRALRERMVYVLKATTGFENPYDPQLIAKQYAEYYGWSEPKSPIVNVKSHVAENRTIFPVELRATENDGQRPQIEPQRAGETNALLPQDRMQVSTFNLRVPTHECFPACTPVETITGPKPIESIRPGDRVLSRDLNSGELAYKTVEERTLRRSMRMVRIGLGEQSIVTTFGHPFWVVGRGWQVAGRLQPGDRLYGFDEQYTVDAVEDAPATEVYNLVVSDFATFFAGPQRLLVHDDTALVETPVVLPGLAAKSR